MNRRSKIEKRLRLSKETLRSLNPDDLALAAGGNHTIAASLSGSRKCHTVDCNSWTC